MPLRVERQCRNARLVADRLRSHPALARVRYPGLPDHPQHELAGRIFGCRGFGAVVGLELKDAGRADVFRFLESAADGSAGNDGR